MALRLPLHRIALTLALACVLAFVLAVASALPAMAGDASDVQSLLARGDLASALQRAEQALQAKPNDPPLRFLRGVVLMELRRDEEALAVFTQLTQEYRELPDPYNNIALLQARAGRPELALQALQTALRNDPSHRVARANLGQVHLMLAAQALEQAAATGPLDPAQQRLLEGVRSLLAPGSAAPSGAAAGR